MRFDTRRRELRNQLHQARARDRDHTIERLMADAAALDEILLNEFGVLERLSTWCHSGKMTAEAVFNQVEQLKSTGVYDGIGKPSFTPKGVVHA